MARKANGDYYYVESETVNDLMDDFAFYQDGTDFKLHDEVNGNEVAYAPGTGLNLPAGEEVQVGGTSVVGPQQTLDDNTAGTADGTLASAGDTTTADQSGVINNNFAEIYSVLAAHGLVA